MQKSKTLWSLGREKAREGLEIVWLKESVGKEEYVFCGVVLLFSFQSVPGEDL